MAMDTYDVLQTKELLANKLSIPSASGNSLTLFNTSDRLTNTEYLKAYFSANTAYIESGKTGTGTSRNLQLSGPVSQIVLSSAYPFIDFTPNSSATAGAIFMRLTSGSLMTASSGTQYAVMVSPTVNQSGTAAYVGLTVDVTETTTGSGTKSLIVGNVGGTQKFRVDNTGVIYGGSNAFLIASSVSLTSGAAAQVATLTNAPSAGNPSKWIAINDNGSTRYIPAW